MRELLSNFSLFANAYLAALMIAPLLAIPGVVFVYRNQIFSALAAAQSSMFGVALGMWILPLSKFFSILAAVLFGILALFAAIFSMHKESRETSESIAGLIYLLAASGSLIILVEYPAAQEAIHQIITSSLFGAEKFDVYLLLISLIFTLILTYYFFEYLKLIAIDPEFGALHHIAVRKILILFYLLSGSLISLSMYVSGVLFTSAALILPGIAARKISNSFKGCIILAPLIALMTSFLALVFSYYVDLPPGQSAAFFMGFAALLCSAQLRRS